MACLRYNPILLLLKEIPLDKAYPKEQNGATFFKTVKLYFKSIMAVSTLIREIQSYLISIEIIKHKRY